MRIVPIITALLLVAIPSLAREKPAWTRADCPFRVVFRLPARPGRTALVNVPTRGAKLDPSGFEAVLGSGEAVPLEILRIGRDSAQVLVKTESSRPKGELVLYYGGKGRPRGAAIRDPSPFRIDRHRIPGGSMPNSWKKALHLLRRSGRSVESSYKPGLGELPGFDGSIAVVRSLLRCPEDGIYTFGIRARGVGFMAVDGELVANQVDPHMDASFKPGASLRLDKGAHRVDIWSFHHRNAFVMPAWTPPGAKTLATIPATSFCTATEISEQRLERIDRTLHPGFTHKILTAYTFGGNPAVFVPVQFKDMTSNWLARNTRYEWSFSNGVRIEETNPRHVLLGAGFHRVSLSVRDSLGFEASAEQEIDCRLADPEQYAVAAEIVRLPPVCYPSDAVEPALRVSGDVPENRPLKVAWTIHARDGDTAYERDVSLVERYVDIPLCHETTHRLRRITWKLLHHDACLESGEIAFSRPPFEEVPTTVRGDHLFDRQGRLVVLVPYQHAGQRAQPPISTKQAFGHVACVDDSLAAPDFPGSGQLLAFDRILARIVNGPDRPIVRYVTLPGWDAAPQASGRLLKLIKVPVALSEATDVAILSLSVRDMLATRDVGQFEREIAALTDLLSATMGIPVVWVTPPPYPPDPAAVRPYAAAVQKIAGARHVPVADLFTAFLASRPNYRDFFRGDDLILSPRGQQLAARIIARALLSTSGADDS